MLSCCQLFRPTCSCGTPVHSPWIRDCWRASPSNPSKAKSSIAVHNDHDRLTQLHGEIFAALLEEKKALVAAAQDTFWRWNCDSQAYNTGWPVPWQISCQGVSIPKMKKPTEWPAGNWCFFRFILSQSRSWRLWQNTFARKDISAKPAPRWP